MIYTVTRTFSNGNAPLTNEVDYSNKNKAVRETNKTALLIAQYAHKPSAGLLTLTNAKGVILATWSLEPNTVDIYGKWRSGYGVQQAN